LPIEVQREKRKKFTAQNIYRKGRSPKLKFKQ
jgi:hypothetical protein